MARDPEIGAALRAASNETLADVVAGALEQARGPYRAAAALLASDDADVVDRAMAAFDEGAELGLAPLMDVAGLPVPMRAWQIASVGEGAIGLRRQVLRWVLAQLDDRAALPAPGKARPRVCDEAYLLLGSLVPFGDAHPTRRLDRAAFLALPAWKRDTLIKEAKGARQTRRTLGEDP